MSRDIFTSKADRLRSAFGPFSSNLKKSVRGLFLMVLVGSSLIGCSPLYVIRAAYEEGKILWRREPIQQFLAKDDTDPETREKLRLVLEVREYARDHLKLNVGGSYASHSYVDRPVLSYILMAASKTELKPYTWWFLFVGSVPYKGYFSKESAEAEANRLEAAGYDTYIRPTAAFSTLGWFDDPLLAHLLRYDRVTLAELIFHELLHNTLYVKGAGAFNESMANFVGHRAAIEFFRKRAGEESDQHRGAVRAWEEELEFSGFIEEVARSLRDMYAREIPAEEKLKLREEIFSRSQEEWRRRIASRPEHRFRGFARQDLNNAVIMHYLVYLKDLELFESLYRAEGESLVRVIDSIRESLRSGGDPFETLRRLVHKGSP